MIKELDRYSVVNTHLKRELLLLQGLGCIWRKCKFCDYYNDISDNPFEINKPIIDKISGLYGVVDVINSGSFFELDDQTKEYLKQKLIEKRVHTLWCECHWLYHNRLHEISDYFKGIQVKFRIGAETFDAELRDTWNKGINNKITAQNISEYFDGACLLVCIKGQTKETIIKDIELAFKYFEYFNVNVFIENGTQIKKDKQLEDWFIEKVAPELEKYSNIEVLVNNTDLGVG